MTRRERWFGGTGRKVPELALVGTIDVVGALELDDVSEIDAGIVVNVAGPHSFVINRMAGVEELNSTTDLTPDRQRTILAALAQCKDIGKVQEWIDQQSGVPS